MDELFNQDQTIIVCLVTGLTNVVTYADMRFEGYRYSNAFLERANADSDIIILVPIELNFRYGTGGCCDG